MQGPGYLKVAGGGADGLANVAHVAKSTVVAFPGWSSRRRPAHVSAGRRLGSACDVAGSGSGRGVCHVVPSLTGGRDASGNVLLREGESRGRRERSFYTLSAGHSPTHVHKPRCVPKAAPPSLQKPRELENTTLHYSYLADAFVQRDSVCSTLKIKPLECKKNWARIPNVEGAAR